MFKKITIIGLGLMGGSLAAACRKKFPKARIVGVSRSHDALTLAKKKKWAHEVTREVLFGAHGADLIVLCTPVDTFLPYLEAIDKVCSPGALVIDVGSVKEAVLKEVNSRQWKNLSFVGCHPMVGSHKRGIQAVNPDLYKEGLVILTRDVKTCPRAYTMAKKFWWCFTSRIIELTPEVHDQFVGEVSHLPHAIAACLTHTVSSPALQVASSGFRDTTRIASAASSIWQPIFSMNQKVMLNVLGRFERELRTFKTLLRSKDTKKLARFLDQAAQKRNSLRGMGNGKQGA
ncbi:MAG: prephenate dehydrogenase/arogenate dehydrogenase family protein [Candidatus Omnitrophota bacterium]